MELARDGIAHEPCTVNEALLLCPAQALLGPYVCSLRSSASPRLPPSCLSPPSLLRRIVCSQEPLARCGNSGAPHTNLCAHLLQHVTLCCKPGCSAWPSSIVRVHADGCGYSTRVPCLKFPGISDGIRGRTDIANNRLTTNPTSSYLQMIKASSSTLESQQACELPPGRARLARRSQGRCHAYRNLPVNQRRRTTASCAVHRPAALAVAVLPVFRTLSRGRHFGKGHLWPRGTASFASLLSPEPYREQLSRSPSSL